MFLPHEFYDVLRDLHHCVYRWFDWCF